MPSKTTREVDITAHHLDDAMRLVAEAGWNQVHADWHLAIAHGVAFGIEDINGRLVASALVLPYGPSFGWISMVLVTRAWRRKGLATRLLAKATELHEAAGRAAVLDATPAGEQVYAGLGFEPWFGLRRWQRNVVPSNPVPIPAHTRPVRETDLDTILHYDREIFGGDRGYVVADIVERGAPCLVFDGTAAHGLSRTGRVAQQLGPITADEPHAAIALLHNLLGQVSGPAFIDIPDDQQDFAAAVETAGFVAQRPLKRMVHGPQRFGDPTRMFALAGPELG